MSHCYFRYFYLKTSVNKQYPEVQEGQSHTLCEGAVLNECTAQSKLAWLDLLLIKVVYFAPLCDIPFPLFFSLLFVISSCLSYLLPLYLLYCLALYSFSLQKQP